MVKRLSNASDKPVYEQITQQIKQVILAGNLIAGESLHSFPTSYGSRESS